MSFSSSIHNVTRICGYNQAVRHFEETKKPRTVRWGEDERPLYNTRSHHYRLVKGSDDYAPYYDLVLYDTSMIRYYQPDANGDSRVLVRGHHTPMSNNFLWHHGFQRGKQFNCVDGYGNEREGKMLLNHHVNTQSAREHGVPRDFSADLYFLKSNGEDYYNLLDLTRSKHIPGYKAASSDEDKAKRKQLKGIVDHWIELLGYRLEEYLNTEMSGDKFNKWQLNRAGDSFTTALDLLSWDEKESINAALRHALNGVDEAMNTEIFVNAMTQFGHAVATHLKGVRDNQAKGEWDYDRRTYFREESKPVTRADFRKSMESHLISLLNLREGSARVDIGQFPASIPRKWWC